MSTKKWNARTVIRRALIVAETLLKGETPRFKLYGDVPYYLFGNYIDTVIGPQYVNTDVVFPSWYELTGLNSGNDVNYTYGNQGYIYDPITNEVLGATGTDKNQQITVNIRKPGIYLLRYTIGYYYYVSPVINSANWNVDYYVVFI